MAQHERPLSPFMQLQMHYRWQYTMALSILHRMTGVFLSVGLPLLVYWLAALAKGADAYADAQRVFALPLVKTACFIWLMSFMYHMLNGIRHLLWDLGYGFEKAVARKSGWLVFILSLVLTASVWMLIVNRLMSATNLDGGSI